jgi:hypothetical protein
VKTWKSIGENLYTVMIVLCLINGVVVLGEKIKDYISLMACFSICLMILYFLINGIIRWLED